MYLIDYYQLLINTLHTIYDVCSFLYVECRYFGGLNIRLIEITIVLVRFRKEVDF